MSIVWTYCDLWARVKGEISSSVFILIKRRIAVIVSIHRGLWKNNLQFSLWTRATFEVSLLPKKLTFSSKKSHNINSKLLLVATYCALIESLVAVVLLTVLTSLKMDILFLVVVALLQQAKTKLNFYIKHLIVFHSG